LQTGTEYRVEPLRGGDVHFEAEAVAEAAGHVLEDEVRGAHHRQTAAERELPVIPETVRNEPSDAGVLRNRLNILNFHDNDLFAGLGVTASSEQCGYTQKE